MEVEQENFQQQVQLWLILLQVQDIRIKMCQWVGAVKRQRLDIKESTHQYFVRFSGNDTALIEKCKKAFGEVKVLQLEGEDEFAILTGTMKEDDFKQIVEKIPETIKFIRAIL